MALCHRPTRMLRMPTPFTLLPSIAEFLLILCVALASSSVRADNSPPTTAPAVEDFPISYWCGPPPEFATIERYREIKDAGFTFVMPSCGGGHHPEENRKLLDLCQQVSLKAFIADRRMPMALGGDADAKRKLDKIIAEYSKHPALLGYFITDEPGAGAFAGLGEVVQYLKEHDPQHPAFINVLPNYASAQALGTKTYDEYLQQYLAQVKPFALS